MAHTLESFAAACSAAVGADPGPGGRQKVCALVREHLDWQGHTPQEIQAMKDAIAGLEPIDD